MADALSFTPVDGIGEVRPGDVLAAIVASLTELADGDVVVVTSKVVSKSLGLATTRAKDELLADETDREKRRRERVQEQYREAGDDIDRETPREMLVRLLAKKEAADGAKPLKPAAQ